VSKSDVKLIIDTVEKYVNIANEFYRISLKIPLISFKLRGRVAGKASGYWVKYNLYFFKANREDFLNSTVPHEVAHYVQKNLFRYSSPHGIEWKRIMHLFGCPPIRCHSYDLNVLPKRKSHEKFLVYCNCGVLKVGKTVYVRFKNGTQYKCRTCKSKIRKYPSNEMVTLVETPIYTHA
jgi:SprT protein